MIRIAVVLALVLGVSATLTGLLFYTGIIRFNYPSLKSYPVRGIDISHHQRAIDWPKVAGQGIQFAYIKATEGGNHRDRRYTENWREAQKAGIVVGAYHFFTFCRSGREQALNFIRTVPKQNGVLPPAVDLEFGGNCQMAPGFDLRKELHDYRRAILSAYARDPIFYVTPGLYRSGLVDAIITNQLWFRNIYGKPQVNPADRWIFWQYANRGRIPGINTYVDLNVFNGNTANFEDLVK